jgi:hypothetical protein
MIQSIMHIYVSVVACYALDVMLCTLHVLLTLLQQPLQKKSQIPHKWEFIYLFIYLKSI